MIRSLRYGVVAAATVLTFAFGAFAAPVIVSPADYSEIKTVSDRIWEDINSATYLKQETYYVGTHTNSFRANGTTDAKTNSIPIRLQWVGSKGTSTVKLYRTRDLEKSASAEPLYTAQTEGNAITYFDPEVGRNYTWTVTDSTGATATGHFYTMELWLAMPTVVPFTIANVTWIEDPDFSEENQVYCIVVRWNGKKLLANIAYREDLTDE